LFQEGLLPLNSTYEPTGIKNVNYSGLSGEMNNITNKLKTKNDAGIMGSFLQAKKDLILYQ